MTRPASSPTPMTRKVAVVGDGGVMLKLDVIEAPLGRRAAVVFAVTM